jgi:DNA repair ATPase RecN
MQPETCSTELKQVLSKLDSIELSIFGKVQQMLDTFEEKMINQMDQHLSKLEITVKETTEEVKSQLKTHSNILESHAVSLHDLGALGESHKQKISSIQNKVDSLDNVKPKKNFLIGVISAFFSILLIDIFVIIYALHRLI